MFPVCFRGVSWVFPGCFRGVSGVFPRCFRGVSGVSPGVFPGCFRGVSGVFPRCFRGVSGCVSGVFPATKPPQCDTAPLHGHGTPGAAPPQACLATTPTGSRTDGPSTPRPAQFTGRAVQPRPTRRPAPLGERGGTALDGPSGAVRPTAVEELGTARRAGPRRRRRARWTARPRRVRTDRRDGEKTFNIEQFSRTV